MFFLAFSSSLAIFHCFIADALFRQVTVFIERQAWWFITLLGLDPRCDQRGYPGVYTLHCLAVHRGQLPLERDIRPDQGVDPGGDEGLGIGIDTEGLAGAQ